MKIQELGNIDIFGNEPIVKHEHRFGTAFVNLTVGLILSFFVVCGMVTLAIVSTLGWLYGVRQNGVVSGFPRRSSSI